MLNPVRAGMTRAAKDWRWSSYRATAGLTEGHPCLETDWVLSAFGKQKKRTQASYRKFVQAGKGQPSPWASLKNQIYLGGDDFVKDMQSKIRPEQPLQDIPALQKQAPAKPLDYFLENNEDKKVAMAKAYLSGDYTLQQVGEYFNVSYATVSRAVKKLEM